MKTIVATVNGVELTEKRLKVLNRWFENPQVETDIEALIDSINYIKETIIKLLCDENNENYRKEIIESLSSILSLQDELKELIPERE